MRITTIEDVANERVLHLTTTGRRTGVPREIEIWFVVHRGRLYLFAEHGERAAWVKNIRSNPEVSVQLSGQGFGAMARVLNRAVDHGLWDAVAAHADHKYGWGDGLPVELTPRVPSDAGPRSDPTGDA